MRRWTAWVGVMVALTASGCGAAGVSSRIGSSRIDAGSTPTSARLLSYGSCADFLTQVKAEALAEVGPYGLPTPGSSVVSATEGIVGGAPGGALGGALGAEPAGSVPAMAAAGAAGAAGAADAAGAANSDAAGTTQTTVADAPASGFSTTNDQEHGVDEPDIVKTDGRLLVTLRRDPMGLQVASVGPSTRLRGFLSLAGTGGSTDVGSPTGMFLVGSDAVVLAPGSSPVPVPGAPRTSSPGASAVRTTDVTIVSLADPDHPVVSHTFVLQGSEVDARLIAGYIEVVVDSAPTLPFVSPADGSPAASGQATAENRALIDGSTTSDWLPSVTSEPNGTTSTASCSSAVHPVAASGLDTVSVVPIAPDSNQPLPAVTVMGDATTVYASTSSLYVATTPWPELEPISAPLAPGAPGAPGALGAPATTVPGPNDPASAETTDVHGFDLSDPSAPRYVGSGEVPGTLIGQYALSEYQGDLRVATTVGTASPPPSEGSAPATLSDNRITVLQPRGGTLVTVGSVGGLGSGEKIYAVRFIGKLAFVVTFRQTDPLYVVDLSAPSDPRTAGQLDLTGYSSFLQPVGNGLLLGVGEAVDQSLRTGGLQVSLFDVSNPDHPTLVSKLVYDQADSTAETDPHALLYWAPSGLAIMPLEQPGGLETAPTPSGSTTSFDGAVALRVAANGLAEAGRMSQPTPDTAPSAGSGSTSPIPYNGGPSLMPAIAPYFPGSSIERAIVIGSMIYTVSEGGIMASDLSTLAQVAWLPYS